MTKPYLIYLRKSRKDIDAERAGAGETLARHEKELLSLAKKQNLNIGAIYREVVSGETISARPEMQRLLSEVETGIWAGVLVMEIERLARGNTKDQGIVAEAFKYGNTKIITPSKTYDPDNEFDEEYFEFGLFMSRREYKTINRRIQRGRIASVQEGKYIASAAPYGYQRTKIENGKGYTLKIIPEEADIVRLIFHLYTIGLPDANGATERLGSFRIAKHLDSLHIPARKSRTWSASSVRDIISNPTYTGKVRWQWRKEVKQVINGELNISRRKDHNCILYDGLHPPIIQNDTYQLAQRIRESRDFIPKKAGTTLRNPLSGLIYCQKCGGLMTRLGANSRNQYDTLKCPTPYCDNISAPIALIETSLLQSLAIWTANCKVTWKSTAPEENPLLITAHKTAVQALSNQLKQLNTQLTKTYDLLEQGIYTNEIFLERNHLLTRQINDTTRQLTQLNPGSNTAPPNKTPTHKFIPSPKTLPEIYNALPNAAAKNKLLKQALSKVTYLKTEPNKKHTANNANFTLTIFPKIPQP